MASESPVRTSFTVHEKDQLLAKTLRTLEKDNAGLKFANSRLIVPKTSMLLFFLIIVFRAFLFILYFNSRVA